MCLITFALNQHPHYPFILVANRDEFYPRPSQQMHYWPDMPEILAGRDEKLGGTWLGFHSNGKFCAVTNFRRPSESTQPLLSRGQLVTDALVSQSSTQQHLAQLTASRHEYGLYNLLIADKTGIYFSDNQPLSSQRKNSKDQALTAKLKPDLYGLCNASLDTPWPKLEATKDQLRQIITDDLVSLDNLDKLLNDTRQAPLHSLPKTGISAQWEQALSSQFIALENYGTRAKTIVLQDSSGYTQIREISYNASGEFARKNFSLSLPVIASQA